MKVLLLRALESGEILLGKTFWVNNVLIFYHESRDEEWFRDLNSPYGLDQDVAQWLQTMAVEQVHHYVRSSDQLYVVRLSDMLEFGVPHDLPDISRLYLPAPLWTVQEGREYRRPWIEDKVYFADWGAKPGSPSATFREGVHRPAARRLADRLRQHAWFRGVSLDTTPGLTVYVGNSNDVAAAYGLLTSFEGIPVKVGVAAPEPFELRDAMGCLDLGMKSEDYVRSSRDD